jgi:probable phosphoglycerate mutase
MAIDLPRLYLVRHGDTEWTDSGQHTGRTDIPLKESGEERARLLEGILRPVDFARVFTSPLKRAHKTCELAGFGARAQIDLDLLEWDYGRYEGMRTSDILRERPGWELYRDGCPGGEAPDDVAARADRFLKQVQDRAGQVLAFSSGHIIRMIAARWLGLPPHAGRHFLCSPGSIGELAFEHNSRKEPIIRVWNYVAQSTGSPGI